MKLAGARRPWACAALAVAALAVVSPARANEGRYALVVGDNQGDQGDMELRYAELDAQRVSRVLREVGGFSPENVTLLTAASSEDVRQALAGLNHRLRQGAAPGSVLFFFYSGHADAQALHLRGTRLPFDELRGLSAGAPAELRVVVVDSCRSGALTRVKGGRAVPSFEIHVDADELPKGLAILTSSAAGEDAQESDQLGASVFTHHLVSALLGAADRDRDGRVTIDEAFGYAADRTLASTVGTVSGPQHPTYRLEIGGRGDAALAWPGTSRERGTLAFAAAGTYLVQRDGGDGPVVAAIASEREQGRLAIEPGRYFVSQRGRDHLRQDMFTVAVGRTTTVDPGQMRPIEYARVVRKGGAERRRVLGAVAVAGVRGEMRDLGLAWWTAGGARLDLPSWSLELLAGFGQSRHDNQQLTISSRELGVTLSGLHVFDLGRLSLGVGLSAGTAWFWQSFSDPMTPSRNLMAGLFGPLVQMEVPLPGRFYARADGSYLTYLMNTQAEQGLSMLPSYRVSGGVGVYF
jgi:hypothetical protein